MFPDKALRRRLLASGLACTLLLGQTVAFAAQAAESGLLLAQSGSYGGHDDRDQNDRDRRGGDRQPNYRTDDRRGDHRQPNYRTDDRRGDDHRSNSRTDDRHGDSHRYADRNRRPLFVPEHRGHPPRYIPERSRRYRNVIIVRPYGRWYYGYGHYHHDSDAFKWLALTAITLGLLNYLNEAQQRAHEEAQIRATTAPIGDTIHWREGGSSGSVTALRDGYTDSGRYCREFQQTVSIGGRSENAYGTACLQPDGSWQVVDTSN